MTLCDVLVWQWGTCLGPFAELHNSIHIVTSGDISGNTYRACVRACVYMYTYYIYIYIYIYICTHTYCMCISRVLYALLWAGKRSSRYTHMHTHTLPRTRTYIYCHTNMRCLFARFSGSWCANIGHKRRLCRTHTQSHTRVHTLIAGLHVPGLLTCDYQDENPWCAYTYTDWHKHTHRLHVSLVLDMRLLGRKEAWLVRRARGPSHGD
jgi:hypothetical protein